MSQLHRIGRLRRDPWGDLIFVHGLGGHWFDTWAAAPCTRKTFWPSWLARDLPHINVWSLEYEADPSSWLGSEILDRINNLLVTLEAEGLGSRPIVFICHSFGGLLVKQLLNVGDTYGVPSWHNIVKHVCGIVFLATPNKGSHLANYLDNLNKIFFVNSPVRAIMTNEPQLRNLSVWFRNNAKRLGVQMLVFYEDMDTSAINQMPLLSARVVDATSSDPEIEGVVPKALRTNHITIAKPESRRRPLYKLVRQFIIDCITNPLKGEWKRIPFGPIYLGYGDPPIPLRHTKEETVLHKRHIRAINKADLDYISLRSYDERDFEALGFSKLFETDCREWRRKIIQTGGGYWAVMVRPMSETLDLGLLVWQVVQMGPTYAESNWRLDERIVHDIWKGCFVECSDIRLIRKSVIRILDIVNEFTAEDTKIRITVKESGGTVGSIFETEGPGVPEGFVEKYWGPEIERLREALQSDTREGRFGRKLWRVGDDLRPLVGSMTAENRSGGGLCIAFYSPLASKPHPSSKA